MVETEVCSECVQFEETNALWLWFGKHMYMLVEMG